MTKMKRRLAKVYHKGIQRSGGGSKDKAALNAALSLLSPNLVLVKMAH